MNNNQTFKNIIFWVGIIVGICVVVGGMIWLVSLQVKAPQTSGIVIANEIRPTDWFRGNKDASVIITEYSDLQCPACGYYYPILKQLEADFSDKIAVVYRHFPLPMHPHSRTMAYAAEAAGKQGKFFEMHDLIFENQESWTNLASVEDVLETYAKNLNLNLDQFNRDRNSDEIKDKVQASFDEADKIGLSYTPTIFINGEQIQNPGNYDAFKSLIQEKLNENN